MYQILKKNLKKQANQVKRMLLRDISVLLHKDIPKLKLSFLVVLLRKIVVKKAKLFKNSHFLPIYSKKVRILFLVKIL